MADMVIASDDSDEEPDFIEQEQGKIEEQYKKVNFFKQKTAYGILRSDWSSDVCSSD
eukprot:COSAG01_NODE_30017_length_625_cov_0.425856_1_plen_56_part_10